LNEFAVASLLVELSQVDKLIFIHKEFEVHKAATRQLLARGCYA
jgi:hypothetical protein